MEINVNQELLQQRIIQIDQEMTQTKANYTKLEGHLAESQYWLGQLLKAQQDEVDAEAKRLKELEDGQVNEQTEEQVD